MDESFRHPVPVARALAAVPWLTGVRDDAMAQLATGSTIRDYARGETIFAAGSEARGLHIITTGAVRVIRAGARRQFVVHSEGAGGTLGEIPLFEEGTYPATAIAAERTRCVVVSRDAVWRAITLDPGVAAIFLRRLAARVRSFVERLDALAAQSITARLASIVLARHAAARGAPFSLGGTHTQIAEELGTVREIVVRTLRSFRAGGVIRSAARGTYEVADIRALRRIAASDAR